MSGGRPAVLPIAAAALALLGGCERARQDMYDQPRYKPLAEAVAADGSSSARPLPEGSVVHARGAIADTSSGTLGVSTAIAEREAGSAASQPYALTRALLRRGRERYTIWCTPCHSATGDGDGRIVRRGFPRPPSLHDERLHQAGDRQLFDTITRGYGVMAPYDDVISAPDRWAIVAYVRALQLSQGAAPAQAAGR